MSVFRKVKRGLKTVAGQVLDTTVQKIGHGSSELASMFFLGNGFVQYSHDSRTPYQAGSEEASNSNGVKGEQAQENEREAGE